MLLASGGDGGTAEVEKFYCGGDGSGNDDGDFPVVMVTAAVEKSRGLMVMVVLM